MSRGGLRPFESPRAPLDPHKTAVAILSEPRFRVLLQRPQPRTWAEILWQWIGDRWHQLMELFAHAFGLGAHAGFSLGAVVLVLSIGLVVVAIIRLIGAGALRTRTGSEFSALGRRADPHSIYARSLQAARSGAYAQAVALLFHAMLGTLDRRGVLPESPSRTVNECRREIRRRAPQLLGPFDALARAFTRVVYADQSSSQTEWTALHDAYAQCFASEQDAQ